MKGTKKKKKKKNNTRYVRPTANETTNYEYINRKKQQYQKCQKVESKYSCLSCVTPAPPGRIINLDVWLKRAKKEYIDNDATDEFKIEKKSVKEYHLFIHI